MMESEGEITEPLLVSNSAVEALLSDVAVSQQHEEDLPGRTVTSNEDGDEQVAEPNHAEEQDEDIRETTRQNKEAGRQRQMRIPDRVEVTLRIAFSLAVTSVITLGSYPNAIPPSQTVIIGAVASAFTMVFPTLLFSIGAIIFPGMVLVVCVAMLISTLLLIAAAMGGTHAYIICFALVALIIAGITFDKSVGANSSLLMMFTALNTMGFVPAAEEGGIPFVLSLWSESGTTNPSAVFRNGLIGMTWLSLAVSSARLIPPARTARAALTRVLLPKVLTDVATFIRLIIQQHVGGEEDEETDDTDEVAKSPDAEEIDDVVSKVVQDGTLTVAGGIANLTAFEPRLIRIFCQGGTLIDIVASANNLTDAVGTVIFSSLTLRALIRAGFNEMLSEGLQDAYLTAADTLDACAASLAELTPLVSTGIRSEDNDDEMSRQEVYDPIRLKTRASKVERLINFWVANMKSPANTRNHHIDDKSIFSTFSKLITPWLLGGGLGLLVGIIDTIRTALSATTWRRIVYSPYYDLPKLVWSVKYGIGVTVIVSLTLYTDFATFELQTRDPFAGAFFSGWFLIAYIFSTTKTVEGTFKKSVLRALGTVGGAFSAWLALTISRNPALLGIWTTLTSSVLAYYTLPQGFSSRFGLDQDLAWGSGYFAMTQYLIVLTVYKGFGTINDVTVNRIVANLAGIFLSLVLAAIPPGIFGSSPRELQFLLEDKKRTLQDCLRLILDGSKTEHRLPQHDLAARLHRLHATAKATFIAGFSDANAYHKDAQQLKSLPILKVDPRMQVALGNAAVLGASLLSLIRLAILIVESDTELAGFAEGAEERKVLEEIVSGLDIQDDPHHISGYAIIERANDKKEHERPSVLDDNFEETYTRGISPHTMMANFSLYLMHYIMRREKMNVAYGFFGRGRAEYSQCSTLPDHLHFTNSGLFGSTYGIDGLVNKQ